MTPPIENNGGEERPPHHYREDVSDILRRIEAKLSGVSAKLEIIYTDYVSKPRFIPVERLVYGMVGIVLAIIIGALMGTLPIKALH